jgi:DNA modification methylase
MLRTTCKGDLILDPFAGSGAILAAGAKIGGRRVLGIEKLETWSKYANSFIHETGYFKR